MALVPKSLSAQAMAEWEALLRLMLQSPYATLGADGKWPTKKSIAKVLGHARNTEDKELEVCRPSFCRHCFTSFGPLSLAWSGVLHLF